MDKLAVVYSGMNLGVLALWLLIATLAGFIARKIVRGRPVLGLWGDIGFALLGVFLVGTVMKAFDVSLTDWIASLDLGPLNDVTRWVDIFVVAFLGALVLRGVLRPITGRG
ncbi:MAG: hypothetical protein K9G83_00650 [Hyphomonadaceae bacterium]|jgi:uncharacterized membrane protein YeaQ/YmgE (transglycosylase-associated protein family)|nr:hypothetical protein [Hyphomonadaceae bacterium]